MLRGFEYHVFLDNNNDLGQHELQLMKGILEALRPHILERDKDATIHYFQSDGNPTSREFPNHDPEKPNEAIQDFLEASGGGNDHIAAFVSALKSYDKSPNCIPRNIIWITNGASLVAQEEEDLIEKIVEVMTLEAKRGDKLISTHGGDPRYRPCGATFVQIGDNGVATRLFDKLPNSLRSGFKVEHTVVIRKTAVERKSGMAPTTAGSAAGSLEASFNHAWIFTCLQKASLHECDGAEEGSGDSGKTHGADIVGLRLLVESLR
ncbi:uncharacterized protein PG986_009667 [Apiospora aurea]|uniref:VWFA domain-containing protein n=1 Tax=Apiospora aurea TaxID=335848 RepID=A0ABR1Q8C7_9PEZI